MEATDKRELKALAGQVVRRRDLEDLGMSQRAVSNLIDSGSVTPLRRGLFRVPPGEREYPEAAYRARIDAYLADTQRNVSPPPLAGPAAHVFWGVPWVGPAPDRIHTASPQYGMDIDRTTQPIGRVPEWQLTEKDGVVVTTPARTVLDTARLVSMWAGVAGADFVLRQGLATREELGEVALSMTRKRGALKARLVAGIANGAAESAGESISRFVMYENHIAPPELQVWVVLPDGTRVRVDFHWAERQKCGEFDGDKKYTEPPTGVDSSRVVLAEKRREDGLRMQGLGVLRWGWQELLAPHRWWIPYLRTHVGEGRWAIGLAVR